MAPNVIALIFRSELFFPDLLTITVLFQEIENESYHECLKLIDQGKSLIFGEEREILDYGPGSSYHKVCKRTQIFNKLCREFDIQRLTLDYKKDVCKRHSIGRYSFEMASLKTNRELRNPSFKVAPNIENSCFPFQWFLL